ncbi:uncharacterized protein LOC143632760 [Bidens hawaiensis]|uniref:uncharacterized protein LOC143632760 n=1 Tax=Bidens hawaiensis TaxID=980011 RepID=UPI0040490666
MAEDMDTEIEDNITKDIMVGIKFKPAVSSSLKPVEGMIFPSLDASYQFYVEYANKGGFSVRKVSQTEKNGFIQYKMVFVPFTGIDNHFRNVNLGAGLIAKETIESYMWHRLCMWHIMKKVADKVGPILCNNEDFKRRICNIVWTDSIEPDEFEMTWHEIVNEFGLIDNSWISTMFCLRSMWIPASYAYYIKVSVIFADNDFSASCSCKRFEQYGLLCRHVFFAFSVFEIDEIPKKYILRRWMRDAVSNKSKCSIFDKDVANGNIDKANEIVRDIMFATENICNMLFTDIETLSKVRDQINGMREKAEEGSQAKPILKKNDMLASLLGYDQLSTSTIRVPTGIRNKGRGSHKRFKSLKEIAAIRARKRSRVCSVCGEGGHDIRTCKKMLVYPPKHLHGP